MEYIDAKYEDIKDMVELNIKSSYDKNGSIYWYRDMLLKRFVLYPDGKKRQLSNLEFLNSHEIFKNDHEFLFPSTIVRLDGIEAGMLLPLYESRTLNSIFQDSNIPIEKKRNCLTKIGLLLERIDNYRKVDKDLETFYLGDLHGGNFLFNEDGNMKVIDLDSCNINREKPFPILYNFKSENLKNPRILEKYPMYDDTNLIAPSINSDIYCYICTILSNLLGVGINSYTIDDYDRYLDYLLSIGFGSNIINCFSKIYSIDDNINPVRYLSEIPDNYTDAHMLKYIEYQRNSKI